MISTPTWVSGNSVMEYQTEQKDNYYQKEGELGTWQGRGAEALGFKQGETITKEDLENVLFGKDKEGKQVLENIRLDKSGDRLRAGLDLTFNAPKSVSVAMEAAEGYGDTETAKALLQAHQEAVEKVLNRIEDNYAQTRITNNGVTERVQTNNLAIAKFDHFVARPVTTPSGEVLVDPSLHTHAVVMNMTQIEGKWRSLESKQIFENYIKEGTLYRAELANNLKELGFEIRITDAKKGFFELKNVDDKVIEEFSNRSRQLEKLVDDLKAQYPDKSESEIKQMATWKSREWKGEIDRNAVIQSNKERLENLGYTKEDILKRNEVKELTTEEKEALKLQEKEIANKAVNNALEAVTSQTSVFKTEDILEKAAKFTLKDQLPINAINKAFNRNKEIVKLTDNYFTSKEIIKAEKSLIKALDEDKAVGSVYETRKEAIEKLEQYSLKKQEATGYGLTKGQKEAAAHILSKNDLVIGIQGDAGTGKTTMLKAVNEFKGNTKLIGLSYTGKAASEIQKATASKEAFKQAGIESQTISRFLGNIEKLDEAELAEFKDSKLIVDEASMLGTKDAKKLVDFAKRAKAQVVLMGDVKQLKAINAGSPFDLLQDKGMKTARMSEVLRQKDSTLKKAVAHLNKYDSQRAFDVLDKRGLIKESENGIEDVKKEFFKFNDTRNTKAVVAGKESYKDNIVLTNTNKMKDELNSEIRKELKERGEIADKDYKILTRESSRLKPSEVYLSENYEIGNSVFIQKSIDKELKAGKEFKITNINNDKNSITLSNGEIQKEVNLSHFGSNLQQYEEVVREFSKGDKIVFTKNDKKLNVNNGETATIKDINSETGMLHLEKDGKDLKFNVNDYRYLDHGYAITTHKSQGQTARNVVAYMDSKAQNFNSFYVSITRAEDNIKIFTDNKEDLKKFIDVEQEKLNAVQAKGLFAQREREWGEKEAAKIPATPKQLKTANNIAKALDLEFDETSKNAVGKFIEENIKEYKQHLLNQPASDKQIDFAKKISSTLNVEFEGNTRKEVKEFIDKYSEDFTEYINDRTGYLTKTNPANLQGEEKEEYLKKFYNEMNRNIAKQDIDGLDKQFKHLSTNDPKELEMLGKDMKIEAYSKAFRIKNKEVVERVAEKHFGEDDFLKEFYSKNPLELAKELNDNDLNYKHEKDLARAEIVKEKYSDYMTDKMGNAQNEEEFNELLKKEDDFKEFVEDFKEEKVENFNYDKTIKGIEEHLENGDAYRAAKAIEDNRDILDEADLSELEEKLDNVFDENLQIEADSIREELQEEEKHLLEEDFESLDEYVEGLENYKDIDKEIEKEEGIEVDNDDFLEKDLEEYVNDLENAENEIDEEENGADNEMDEDISDEMDNEDDNAAAEEEEIAAEEEIVFEL